ncbi:flavin reductase family protein [Chthonobacter albigriseus]|uniref:flavin reductase family protein n=1 Tax=Chthonobacter albigriseus TaxID=1683161 RepID=UPI0015EF77A5|nr:flavin reductase family protein [Chthonobacter albigriseus]
MFYDPRRQPHGLPHDPFLALVAPRPIGWISTVSAAGVRNLAPYSFFNAFSSKPAIVGFSGSGMKDSVRNAAETGGFVCNIVSEDLKEAMNASSVTAPPEVDEFAVAGLAAAASELVAAPRVALAKAALECIHLQTIPLMGSGGGPVGAYLVLGEVVGVHIADDILTDGLVDVAKLRPVSRLGYRDYAVIDETFEMARPAPH